MMASQPTRWLGVLGLVLASLTGMASLAEENPDRPLFVRVDKDDSGEPRALQTAVATYEIENGPFRGAKVDLIGAVHVGERSYYRELNRRFKDYDAVLYEEALAHFKARAERYDCPLV